MFKDHLLIFNVVMKLLSMGAKVLELSIFFIIIATTVSTA